MASPSPAETIILFLERLPESVQGNIAAMAVLFADPSHDPRPGDDYLELVRALLTRPSDMDQKRAVVVIAGVLDYHLSENRGMTSDEYLALAKKMPTEFFQMGVLKAPDQNRDFAEAMDEWHSLRATDLAHRVIARSY